MDKKERNKINPKDEAKIVARYESKLAEFKLKSLDELRYMFTFIKMSSTDKHALVMATNHLMQEVATQTLKDNEVTEEAK